MRSGREATTLTSPSSQSLPRAASFALSDVDLEDDATRGAIALNPLHGGAAAPRRSGSSALDEDEAKATDAPGFRRNHRGASSATYAHVAAADDDNGDKGDAAVVIDTADDASHKALAEQVDGAIEALGFGPYQRRLCLLSGLLWMADSMEVSLLSFLYECVGASFGLTSVQAASIVSIVFAGELVGAALAGPVADAYGRRPTSVAAAACVAVFGGLTVVAPNFGTFVALRALVGVGVGALAVPFDLMAEFLPQRVRGTMLTAIEFAWALGATYATAASWLLRAYSWRLLVLACALPFVFVLAGVVLFVDESPKWLAERGDRARAGRVLRRVALANRVDFASTCGCASVFLEDDEEDFGEPEEEQHASSRSSGEDDEEASSPAASKAVVVAATGAPEKKNGAAVVGSLAPQDRQRRPIVAAVAETLGETVAALRKLFATPLLRRRTALIYVVWCGFGLCFYGISLLTTRLFGSTNDDDDRTFRCDFDYELIFGVTTSQFVGTALLMLTVNRLGRVASQTLPYAATALALAPVALGARRLEGFACLYVALGAQMMGSCATWVHCAELYPTELRSTGHSLALTVSRLAAFSSSYLVDSTLEIVTVATVLGAVAALSAVAAACLPETKDAALH